MGSRHQRIVTVLKPLISISLGLWVAIIWLTQFAFGAAITSNGTGGGNWASTGTWSGGAVPGTGDTVTLANGDTVTIPVSTSVTVGASPADDTGSPAIQCASSSGTGVLALNGTLIYQGPLRLCKDFGVGAGATLTHDSHLAATPSTAHYSIQQTNGFAVKLNGTIGSRVTWNIAGSSGQSGGFTGAAAGTAHSGLLTSTYADISGCGTSAISCVRAHIDGTDVLDVEFTDFENTGIAIDTGTSGQISAGGTYKLDHVVVKNQVASTPYAITFSTNAAKTTGTRSITNSTFENISYLAASFTLDPGLTVQNDFFYALSQTTGCITAFGGLIAAGDWANNVCWTDTTETHGGGGGPLANTMGGVLQRTYMLYDVNVSGDRCDSTSISHFLGEVNLRVELDSWVAEPWCGTTQTKFFHTGTGTGYGANFAQTIHNSILLPGLNGVGFTDDAIYINSAVCNETSTFCPQFSAYNNTIAQNAGPGGGQPYGYGGELSSNTPGIFQGLRDHIFFRPSAGTGGIAGWSPGSPPANGTYAGTTDYNINYNLSPPATGFYDYSATAVYTTPPGTHDQTINPQFVDSTRNFLSWCKSLDGTIVDWYDCKVKFEDQASGSHNAAFNPSAAIDYVFSGYAPTNPAIATASSTGSYVGAVAPVIPPTTVGGGGRHLWH